MPYRFQPAQLLKPRDLSAPPASASHAPHEKHAPQVQAFASNRQSKRSSCFQVTTTWGQTIAGKCHRGFAAPWGQIRIETAHRENQIEQVTMVKSLTYPFQLASVLITITGSWQSQHCSLSCTRVTRVKWPY